MIIYDYKKSEEMAKDIFKAVDNMEMQVKETQEELSRALQLIMMCKEYGPGICELWDTAVRQSAALSDSYKRGFQDGVKKEHDRIMNILREKGN